MATPRKAAASLTTSTGLMPATATAAPAAGKDAAAADKDTSAGSSVQVVVRCRPANDKEKASGDSLVVGCYPSQSEVRVLSKKGAASSSAAGATGAANAKASDTKTYTFDATYGALSTQEEVYNNTVKPLVEEVLGGFNVRLHSLLPLLSRGAH